MNKNTNEEKIIDINYEDEMSQSYIDYAMKVIGDRALPDVRDGLKPVQRRILFAMDELKNYPDKPYKKSARIVGDTMGKYHPHGDCLRGDTKVILTNGEIKTIKELYDIGEDQEIWAINDEGEIVKAIAREFRIGQTTNIIYQIVLDNGHIVEVTDNHPFLKANMQYAKANKLKVLDALFTVNVEESLSVVKEGLRVEAIRIKNVLKEDMYDFTVDEYENMLIVVDEEEKTYISVHNSSIYDAMARMSQDFILPNPLVDGHGNFGSIDGDKPAAARYCVTGDTLVPTNKGVMKIKDIAQVKNNSETDIDITIQSLDGENKAIKLFNSGRADIYEIVTDNGNSIKGSFNHPVLVSKTGKIKDVEWVLLKDIRKGDLVVIRGNNIQNSTDKFVLRKTEIKNIVNSLDPKLEVVPEEITSKVLRAKNIEQNYFLAQLFNRFGFVNHSDITLRGGTEHLRDVQFLLLNKGILSLVNEYDKGKSILKIYNYENLLVFFKKIGFLMNNKISHLDLDLTEISEDTEGDTYNFVPVKEAYLHDKQDYIYSLKVDSKCHSFVTNGFVSHNTEARLTPLSMRFLQDLDKDVVDMKKNFDETLDEPEVLPVLFPNLLVNGTNGIAVGMATSIPSHNLEEVCKGFIKYIQKPDIILSQLLKTIKGPDFPTGGVITNKKELNALYKSGEGKITIRSKVEVEDAGYGRLNFVISEVPYNFAGNKERLIMNLIDAAEKGDLDEVIDIRDESSSDGIRIVIETKKGTKEDFFLNKLFSKTQAQTNYRYSFTVIKDGRPVTMGLLEYMETFLLFQRDIYSRKYKTLLKKLVEREEIVIGLLEAIDKLDAVIEAIRGSNSITRARACLMKGDTKDVNFTRKTSEKIAKKFSFTKRQADAILEMRLQRLVGMEKAALEKEHKELLDEIERVEKILSENKELDKEIIKTLRQIIKENPTPRKTKITETELEEVVEIIESEDVYVLYDHDGYIKVIDENSFNRTNKDTLKDYRLVKKILNTEKLYFFTEKGMLYQIDVLDIPKVRTRDKGENVYNLFDIKNDKVIKVLAYPEKGSELLFITANGYAKRVEKEQLVSTRTSVIGSKVREGDILVDVVEIKEDCDVVAVISDKGFALKFNLDEISVQGKNTIGVKAIKLQDDEKVIKAIPFNSNKQTDLIYFVDGKEKTQTLNSIHIKSRNTSGSQFCKKEFELKDSYLKI